MRFHFWFHGISFGLFIVLFGNITSAANTCTTVKVEYPIDPTTYWNLTKGIVKFTSRIILSFKCISGDSPNPIIPIDYGSNQNEYNELVLSPNLYNYMPVNQLCPFENIYYLTLSFNQIQNGTNIFQAISCLIRLQILDLSYNLISTPLMSSDFSDSLGSTLVSLNLNNNNIPFVDTGVFFKFDGKSRFPNLYYLGLANNQIKSFDLIWPLSLPAPSYTVTLKNNPITTISNQLKKTFTDGIFQNVTINSNRIVDITDNKLTSLSDAVFFEYVHSATEFQYFLYKISNYNFKQSTNQLSCFCPPSTGLYTVYWYQSFKNSITTDLIAAPIYQLKCSNLPTSIFDFTCIFIGTTAPPITTTTTTTRTSTITTNPIITSNPNTITTTQVSTNTAEQQIIDETATSSSSSNDKLYLLFLLLIPFFLIIFFCFICLCGRWCLSSCYNCSSIHCCSCLRPDKNNKETIQKKKYDSIIIYGESDELWVNKNIVPLFSDYKNKNLKLQNSNVPLTDEQKTLIHQCRRVVIVYTKKFLSEEWKNKDLQNILKDIHHNDPYCVLIAINVGDINQQEIDKYLQEIDSSLENSSKLDKFRMKLANRISENISLKEIELLYWHDDSFNRDLRYVMPSVKTVKRSTYVHMPRSTNDATENTPRIDSPTGSYVPEKRYSISSNDLPLITSLTKSIEDTKRINNIGSKRVYPVNNDLQSSNTNIKRLSNGMIANENFWISMPVAQAENYEPIGVAGTALEGNKDAYLKRFGVSHGLIGLISEPTPPDNPLPKVDFEASTNKTKKTVRLTRLDLAGTDNQQDDETDIDLDSNGQPVGWTTTDSGRRIIVPESMLTKLGSIENAKNTNINTISEIDDKKKSKNLIKKLKIETQNYLINENRPSSTDSADYRENKAIIKKKDTKEKRKGKSIKKDDDSTFETNEFGFPNSLEYSAKRSKLKGIDEDEKQLQSIIKESNNGETNKSNSKVGKKVTYASESENNIAVIDKFFDELDEHLKDENNINEKKKKKKHKSKKNSDRDTINET